MDKVHVFISTGRFRSFEEMRTFVEETYTEDGDGVDSKFANETDQSEYEPGCIECVQRETPTTLSELLAQVSFADQWLKSLPADRSADSAICVYPPNELENPDGSSLEYIGAFPYTVVHPEWFKQILRDQNGSGGTVSETHPVDPA